MKEQMALSTILKINLLFKMLILVSSFSYSQRINFSIKNTFSSSAAIFSLSGEKLYFIDSVFSDKPGEFLFKDDNIKTGFNSFFFDKLNAITFIYDANEIEKTADANNIKETIEIVNSEINKPYYNFI